MFYFIFICILVLFVFVFVYICILSVFVNWYFYFYVSVLGAVTLFPIGLIESTLTSITDVTICVASAFYDLV